MRVEGREQLLNEHITDVPLFEWGVDDCALWCADWVRKVIGTDFAADWRGRYSCEASLHAILHEQGLTSAEDIADATLPQVDPNFTQRGDIVLHPQGALGICNGIWSYFLMERGMARHPTFGCRKAWKVK